MGILGKCMEFTQSIILSLDALSQQETRSEKSAVVNRSERNLLVLLNYFGMCYTVMLLLTVHFVGVFIIIPMTYVVPDREMTAEEASSLFYAKLFAWYITVNCLSNYILTLYGAVRSVYCSPSDLPLYEARTHPDWTQCSKCDQMVPPRTRHCNICQRCILKRDHHCFFTGCCIGFYNQRHFILFCFHALIGTIYAVYFCEQYLSSHYVSFLGVEFFKYFLPYAFVVALVGHTTWSLFFLIFLFYVTFTSGIVLGYFLIWQFNLLLNGQTSYEFVKGKKIYQTKLSDHIRSTFGPLWAVQFLFPMPWIKNEGNGMDWQAHNTKFL